MPLNTRCSHCGRLFPVYAQQIKERRGKVECPQCGKRFDAIGGLLDEVGAIAHSPSEHPGREPTPRPPATVPANMLDLSEGRAKIGHTRTALWSLGVLLLIAALVLQIGWWDRGRWMEQPRARVVLEALCHRIGCRPEPPRLTGTMEVRRQRLSERAGIPGSLRLTLVLVNKAKVGQRLPELQLELYDEKGGLAAARRFRPDQYSTDPLPGRALAPDAAARAMLDLQPTPKPVSKFRVKLF